MSLLTIERPPAPTSASSPSPAVTQGSAPRTPSGKPTRLLIGLDLGTNKSCILAGPPESTDIAVSKVVPSVVGYVKDGIVDGIITGNVRILRSEERRVGKECRSRW